MPALVVAALAAEVAHVPAGVEVLVTGVGKARATAALARRLATRPPPTVVVNVGTAGAVGASPPAGVVEVGYVTEHDFPHAAIEELLGDRLPRGFSLTAQHPPQPEPSAPAGVVALATGDRFVADAAAAAAIARTGVHLVDMEAFGFAAACAAFDVPMRCAKVVSDHADEAAGMTWLDTVDRCAVELGRWLATVRP